MNNALVLVRKMTALL